MINTVVFDLGNVLVDFCWEKAFHEYFGWNGEIFEKVANATTRHDDWNLHDKGDLTDDDMLARFISNDPSVEAEIRNLFNHLETVVEPRDYAVKWVKDLKAAGYKVYILSNYSRKAFKLGMEDGRLAVVQEADGAVISYQERLIKPGHAIYECLLNRFNIAPEESVFIDDREDNIRAAKECGMNGIVFRDKQQVFDDLEKLGIVF